MINISVKDLFIIFLYLWIGSKTFGGGFEVCSYVYVRKRCIIRRVPEQSSFWRAFLKITRTLGCPSSLDEPLCSRISNLRFRWRCVQGHYSEAKYHCRNCANLPNESIQVSFKKLSMFYLVMYMEWIASIININACN